MARRHGTRQAAGIVVAIILERERAHPLDERRSILLDEDLVLDGIELLQVALRELHALPGQVVVDAAQRYLRAVEVEPPPAILEPVPGYADDALDVVEARIHGIAEHHHLTAVRAPDLDHLAVHHGNADAVRVLVDEAEIDAQWRRNHP